MSLVKSLLRRSLGKNRTCNELSTRMLEEFQCHMTDEHPIIDDEAGTTVPPLACAFCPVGGYTQMLALADENGCVIMYNTLKTGIQAAIAEWLTHKNAVFDLTWLRREQKLLTASGDQTVVLWDASTTDKLEVFKGHTSSVKSVCMGLDNDAVFATGSRDGHIMIWDRRCNKKDQRIPPVNVIKNAHCLPPQSASKSRKKSKLGPALDSQQSVTNVLFQDSNHLVSVGAVDGVIKVWDLRKNYTSVSTDPVPKYSLLYAGFSSRRHGFTSLTFDSSHSQLFASCTDDIIYQYDFINYNQNPVHCYKGHQNSTFYVKTSVSPDDQYITSGSSDQLAYIWKVGCPQESVVTLSGHTAEVTSVAWSPDDMAKIASLSDDNTMRVWRSTKSLGIPGSIVGSAQRVSKEVGVSTASLSVIASPLLPRPGDISHPHTPPSQKRPVAPKTPSSSAVSNGLSARKVSQLVPQTPPSIKHWFTPSRNKDEENKAVTQSPVTTGRTPVCKRKLINVDSDGTTSGPRKRVCRQTLRDISLQNNVDKDNHIPTEQSEQGEIRKEENEELKTEQFTTGPDAISARLGFDAMASPIRKVSTSDAAQTSSPTANLPNLVYGIGVVTPPKPASPACLRKGRSNWLTQLRQKQTERPTLLLSPRSTGHTSQDTEDSDCNILSPTKLKSPLPGSKSILSYFGRRIDRL